jgi:hypothetical protein
MLYFLVQSFMDDYTYKSAFRDVVEDKVGGVS